MNDRIGQQLGNYRIIRKLGEGGFAEVYLGEHLHLNTRAAIKVQRTQLTDQDKEQFLKEARTVASLDHPNIVRVLEFGVGGDTLFLVMSYAPNGSLRQRHPRDTILPLATVVSYIRQVADALQFAHDQKLVHLDIKPENMLVGTRNEILLSDFGLATVARSTRSVDVGNKVIAGTALYMAPEQFLNKPRPASDQYSLGIVVYEWLCGTTPFNGNFLQLAYQHRDVLPLLLRDQNPSVSQAVEQVVMTALAKDPARRFASVRAFANALEQASQEKVSPPRNFVPASPAVPPTPSAPLPTVTASSAATPTEATTDSISEAFASSAPVSSAPSLRVPLPKDAQLNLDTPPPLELFNRILREVGKNARNAG
jgi:serine/threonine protein kinase